MTEISEPDIPAFISKFHLLPNEYEGLSFESAYQNVSVNVGWDEGHPLRETKRGWYRQDVTHSHHMPEGVPGSTIRASITLSNTERICCDVFAVGEIAKSVLAAPFKATIRVRVRTVFAAVPDEETTHLHWSNWCYEEIKGLVIEEILAIEDPSDD